MSDADDESQIPSINVESFTSSHMNTWWTDSETSDIHRMENEFALICVLVGHWIKLRACPH